MNESDINTWLELKGAKEMLVAMQKLIDENKEEILALRTALDKANEKLACAWEDNPPYYDYEAGKIMKTKEECIKWLEMFLNASMKPNVEDQNFIRSIIEYLKMC